MKIFRLFTLTVVLFLFSISCEKVENDSDIKDPLFYELVKYQKENPLRDEIGKILGENIYFTYVVTILPPKYVNSEDENISVFLSCSILKSSNFNKENSYGVYCSSELGCTMIIDEANLIEQFVKKSIKINMEHFIYDNPPNIKKTFPTKLYTLKNNKLILMEEIPGNNHNNK